jgi:adenosylcobinamide amidohydrolase
VWATVGITLPTWAAAHDLVAEPTLPGTINLVAVCPARLDDAALVNTIVTATEAKAQALLDHGVPGTGTASDAVCIACPADGPAERFGGPRSHVGSALARAVYDAVAAGAARGDEP